MAAVPVLIAVLLRVNPPDHINRREALFYFSTRTGLAVPALALEVMSRLLLVAVVALFAGDAIASEAAWGNLRALLARPIARRRLLSAKVAVVALSGIAATFTITLTGLVVGTIAFGWHSLDYAPYGLHSSPLVVVGELAFASIYITWSLAGIAVFGVLVSVLTDSPVAAVAAAFGLYVVSAILDAIDAFGAIRYGLPTHYLDAWHHLFTHGVPATDMARGALLQVAYVTVLLAGAFWWFGRKDVLS
jgi:ABC-2 type transport system permease protein